MSLTADAVDALCGEWRDAGRWEEIRALADRVWSSGNTDLSIRWSHLVLACGNFKRQGGTRLVPLSGMRGTGAASRRTELKLPTPSGPCVVSRDSLDSWRELARSIPGLGVPTMTTVLSALWPGVHVIADRLAVAAAVVIVGTSESWEATPADPRSRSPLT